MALRVPPDRSVDAVGAIVEDVETLRRPQARPQEMSSATKGRTEARSEDLLDGIFASKMSFDGLPFDVLEVSGILVEDSTGRAARERRVSVA